MPKKRKTPYAWEVRWKPEPGGYVPSINVVAWNERAAMRVAENLLPHQGTPATARNLDTTRGS